MGSNEKDNLTTKCMELLNEFSYKKTPTGILAIIDTADGKNEVIIQGKTFKAYIMNEYKEKYGKFISSRIMSEVINVYEGFLYKTLKTKRTVNRIKLFDDKLLINTGDGDYNYYEITAKGWELKSGGDEYFSRHDIQRVLPTPSKKGDFDLLFKYCRIPEELKLIFKIYVITCFLDIIHPGLILDRL